MKVLVFAGSLRREALSKKLARAAAAALGRAGAEVDLADMRDFDVPLYDGDLEGEKGVPPGALALRDRLLGKALCVATPEYNHSIPGPLKNLVDWLSRVRPPAMKGVPVLVMSTSPSLAGGTRAAWALKVPLEQCGMFAFPAVFSLPQADKAFAPDGSLSDPALARRLDGIAQEFVAFARAILPLTPARPAIAG